MAVFAAAGVGVGRLEGWQWVCISGTWQGVEDA